MLKVFVLREIVLLILHVEDGFNIGESNQSRKDDIISPIKTSTKVFGYTIYPKICQFRNAILRKHNLLNPTKTPLANFPIYYF